MEGLYSTGQHHLYLTLSAQSHCNCILYISKVIRWDFLHICNQILYLNIIFFVNVTLIYFVFHCSVSDPDPYSDRKWPQLAAQMEGSVSGFTKKFAWLHRKKLWEKYLYFKMSSFGFYSCYLTDPVSGGCSTNTFVIKWMTDGLWKYLYGAATPKCLEMVLSVKKDFIIIVYEITAIFF